MLEIDAAEPAQHQRVGHLLDGFGVAPRVEVLHDQQPQQHLGGRRVAAMHRCEPIATRQVSAHLLVQLVVLEQVVELDEHGVGLVGQFRHAGKDVFGWIAVDEHVVAPSSGRSIPHSTTSLLCRSA